MDVDGLQDASYRLSDGVWRFLFLRCSVILLFCGGDRYLASFSGWSLFSFVVSLFIVVIVGGVKVVCAGVAVPVLWYTSFSVWAS